MCPDALLEQALLIEKPELPAPHQKKIASRKHFRLFINLSNQLDLNLLCNFSGSAVLSTLLAIKATTL
jgi:hypothetical protein